MIAVLVRALPTYRIHGVGDAAYHGKALATVAGQAPTDAAPHLGNTHDLDQPAATQRDLVRPGPTPPAAKQSRGTPARANRPSRT